MRLSCAVIGVLPQDHDFDLLKRCQAQRFKYFVSGRVNDCALRPRRGYACLQILKIRLRLFGAQHFGPAVGHG